MIILCKGNLQLQVTRHVQYKTFKNFRDYRENRNRLIVRTVKKRAFLEERRDFCNFPGIRPLDL